MFWRVFILVVLSLINIILFIKMVWGPTGLLEYRDLKNRHAELTEKIAALNAENISLSREIRLLRSNEQYVEKMIWQRLHYVRENEILYLFGDSVKPVSGAADDGKN